MEANEKYTSIIENITGLKKINKNNSDVHYTQVSLLNVLHVQLIKPFSKGDFLIEADTVDRILGTREVLSMKYESENNISSEIIMNMISSFSLGNDTTKSLDFIIRCPSDNNIYHIETVLIIKD